MSMSQRGPKCPGSGHGENGKQHVIIRAENKKKVMVNIYLTHTDLKAWKRKGKKS